MTSVFWQEGHRLRRLARWGAIGTVALLGVAVLWFNHVREPTADPVPSAATASAATLTEYAAKLSGFESTAGFGAVVADHAGSSVTVYWKGQPPAPVSEAVASAPAGIHAILRPCAYSADELAAAAGRIWKQSPATIRSRLAVVEPTVDRSGLVVHVTGDQHLDEAAIGVLAGVPTQVQYGATKPQPLNYPAPTGTP